ncbi:hypothetical protein JCM8097_008191 [Rhodosporidiobolus ruineniae]
MRSVLALFAVLALSGFVAAAPAALPETTSRPARTLFRDRIASTTTTSTTSTAPSRTLFRDRPPSSTTTPAAAAQPTFKGTHYGISEYYVEGGLTLTSPARTDGEERFAPYNACPDPTGSLAAHRAQKDYALVSPSFAAKHGDWLDFCGKSVTITTAGGSVTTHTIVGECAAGYCPDDGVAFAHLVRIASEKDPQPHPMVSNFLTSIRPAVISFTFPSMHL